MPAPSDPNAPAVFIRHGDEFAPTQHAVSPWGSDRLHGGPVLGLLTRAVESALGDEAWLPTRLTFDLFRPAPRERLRVQSEVVRSSSRLRLVTASVLAGPTECARVTALSLRRGGASASGRRFEDEPRPEGPAGIETGPLLRGEPNPNRPDGFHTCVETRWLPQRVDEPLAIWFRLPMPLVAGETSSPLQRAAAIADFCNAVASLSARAGADGQPRPAYINTDTNLYLARRPVGEWICLLEQRGQEHDGISLTQTALCDEQGCFGHSLQARLANG